MESDAYIHRIGRTARAGESGKALSFCSEDEVTLLREVEKLIKRKVSIYDHDYHAAKIEHHHTRVAPAQMPKQGGGGNRRQHYGAGNRRAGQGVRRRSRPQGSGNTKPKSDSRPTGGFQKSAGQSSNRSRGRNR